MRELTVQQGESERGFKRECSGTSGTPPSTFTVHVDSWAPCFLVAHKTLELLDELTARSPSTAERAARIRRTPGTALHECCASELFLTSARCRKPPPRRDRHVLMGRLVRERLCLSMTLTNSSWPSMRSIPMARSRLSSQRDMLINHPMHRRRVSWSASTLLARAHR